MTSDHLDVQEDSEYLLGYRLEDSGVPLLRDGKVDKVFTHLNGQSVSLRPAKLTSARTFAESGHDRDQTRTVNETREFSSTADSKRRGAQGHQRLRLLISSLFLMR